MYVAVSGNLGSGKSTVARGLADFFNCVVYPRTPYDTTYIEDLFREPKRWTAEAQISFMLHKYNAVRDGLSRGRLFILDRTFSEDVRVFAERFHDDGTIDARSIDTIRQLAIDLEERLSPPRLIVFCSCPVEVCKQRLAARKRSYQQAYPPDHLDKLQNRLEDWLRDLPGTPLITISTHETDFRQPASVAELGKRIDALVSQAPTINQFELFGEDFSNLPDQKTSLVRPRKIYLAAPFTNRAKMRDLAKPNRASLFVGSEYIENIPRSYRQQLLSLVRAIEHHGHRVLLPHRDINRWGSRALPASEIAKRCLAAVDETDGIISLIAESFGSHAELGYALGRNKPALLLVSASMTTSFFGTGLAAIPGIAKLTGQSVASLSRTLRQTDPWRLMMQEQVI